MDRREVAEKILDRREVAEKFWIDLRNNKTLAVLKDFLSWLGTVKESFAMGRVKRMLCCDSFDRGWVSPPPRTSYVGPIFAGGRFRPKKFGRKFFGPKKFGRNKILSVKK